MADFVVFALIAGISIALVAGPLGCFVVWRRMSYFGDTLAHSSLLGVALAILLNTQLQIAIIGSCLSFAALLLLLERKQALATDTLRVGQWDDGNGAGLRFIVQNQEDIVVVAGQIGARK